MNLVLIRGLLAALDRALTGKPLRICWRTSESQVDTIAKLAEWDSIEYYLSDGGYSRVWINPFDGRVFISDNSLSGPKSRWAGSCLLVVAELIEEFTRVREADV